MRNQSTLMKIIKEVIDVLTALLALVRDEEDSNKEHYYVSIGRTETETEILMYERIDAKYRVYTMLTYSDADVPKGSNLIGIVDKVLKNTEHSISGLDHMKFLELTKDEYTEIIKLIKE